VRLLGHRQTKGAATDKPNLLPPRHISTLPRPAIRDRHSSAQKRPSDRHDLALGSRRSEQTLLALQQVQGDVLGGEKPDSGDAVLRRLGQILQSQFRKSDLTCRFGGEEFTV
jgi:hypothetical protein